MNALRPMLFFFMLPLIGLAAIYPTSVKANPFFTDESLSQGFTPIDFISPTNFYRSIIEEGERKLLIKHFCKTVRLYYKKYKWNEDPCEQVAWQTKLRTKNGHPLIYAEFGKGEEVTLILGGVHPDEITPIPISFRVAKYLQDNPDTFSEEEMKIIVAPLVNPDGFLRNLATRTNSNGIDLNRNFFTLDWFEKAKKLWQHRRDRVNRHFPGYFPNTEVETIFQIQLIDMFQPDKILSIHAPLGFLDYDGPGDGKPRHLTPAEENAKSLVTAISRKARNYRVVDYTFYPGSLGNYAGNERNIPTVTLELETTDPSKVDLYWDQFLPGILQSIKYRFRSIPNPNKGNASPLSSDYSAETISGSPRTQGLN